MAAILDPGFITLSYRGQVVQRNLDAKIQGWEEKDKNVTWNEQVYVCQ